MVRSVIHTMPAIGLCLLCVIACSGGRTQVKPSKLARERVEAIARAHAEDQSFMVRLNPTACDCPAHEVLLDGQFHRVFLEPAGTEGPAAETNAGLEAAAAGGRTDSTATVAGRLSRSARLAPNMKPCLVLTVTRIVQ